MVLSKHRKQVVVRLVVLGVQMTSQEMQIRQVSPQAATKAWAHVLSDNVGNQLSEVSGGQAENGKRSEGEVDNEGEGEKKKGSLGILLLVKKKNLFTVEYLDELEEE